MVAAVAEHGYAQTTITELVALAGVSKRDFYALFDGKDECFLSTFDVIMSAVVERVGATDLEGDPRERMRSALTSFMELVVAEPEAAVLTAVEAQSLGLAGIAHRDRAADAFQAMIEQGFERAGSRKRVSGMAVRAVVAGILGVVYRHLIEGRLSQLPGTVDGLVDWTMSYQRPDNELARRAIAGARAGSRGMSEGGSKTLGWREPPDSRRSRAELSQRERIMRAVAQLVTEKGFSTLSIPSISARAGTSNQTFYEYFSSKREVLLAVSDVIASEAIEAARLAYGRGEGGPRSVGMAIRGTLEYLAANELFAQVAFLHLQTAGPIARDRVDTVVDRFAAFIFGGEEGWEPDVPDSLPIAIGSGCWSIVQHELILGDASGLPALAPALARVIFAPHSGPVMGPT